MYDLVVIGGGPAGAAAARTAAKCGLKTLLVERERFPRDKLCGGGLTPKVLSHLDFTLPNDLIEQVTRGVRIHVGHECYKFAGESPLVYMTSRSRFDNFLVGKAVEAGVEFSDKNPVNDLQISRSSVNVRSLHATYEAKIVIIADGAAGQTAYRIGLHRPWTPKEVAYAIESDVPVSEQTIRNFMGDLGFFDIYFGVSPAGYGWIFPKNDRLTVGVGCSMSRLRDGPELFQSFVKGRPELENCAIPRPRAHLVPIGGSMEPCCFSDRLLLTGDAAGFAEPLLGEGIYYALWGGQLAGEVAAGACHRQRFDRKFLGAYQNLWRKAFGADFEVGYRVGRFTYLEQYDMERVVSFFFSDRKVRDCMMGVMKGSLRYRDVQRKLAWKYLRYGLRKFWLTTSRQSPDIVNKNGN